ncbi:MAG: superfamily helicase, partial [Chloroflexi bacterium]|nr:superfamily helicase [Chloroflexota bacterium]
FDSPLVTFLDQEIRELKNYPMVCQSLQAVAASLKFDWNVPEPYRQLFRSRMFDFWGKLDDHEQTVESPWYFSRARFNSQIPLEYAYAAWADLPMPGNGADPFTAYRHATGPILIGFHARRLEALEHITADFKGNKQTLKTPFDLGGIATFSERARTLAHALDEFVMIERHVDLAAWKAARLAPPERRVLAGDALVGSFHECEQDADTNTRNRENVRRFCRKAELTRNGVELSKEEKKELKWSQDGMRVRLRFDAPLECSIDEMLGLKTLREGDRVVVCPRWDVDSRLPAEEQVPYTPTPKQLLYGTRATIVSIRITRDDHGRAVSGTVELEMRSGFGGKGMRGFVFGSMDKPFEDGAVYSIDEDPNDWYGYHSSKVTEELCAGGHNTLYSRLVDMELADVYWPDAAVKGQARFLAGLEELSRHGLQQPFEDGKQAFIGRHGDAEALQVQGPPGTGKSYTTAFALLARLQGALAAGIECRVFVTCKTHAATDVLLGKIVEAQEKFRKLYETHEAIFAEYFDARLLDIPLFRMAPQRPVHDGVKVLYKPADRPKGDRSPVRQIEAERHCVVATAPGGTYAMVKEEWPKALLGHELCDCLVLDEASQMNLPEAAMAALLLKQAGQLIVVGDHRQMPPIVKHDWSTEPRRTFQEYRTYESLFATLLPLATARVKFEESFRLHRDMAEFLRREIYQQDGIEYFSRQGQALAPHLHDDPFLASVLDPGCAIVVIVHEEDQSQLRNPYEQGLITPILDALALDYDLGPAHGLGVVVPHRAQRAALQDALPALTIRDPNTGTITLSAVDTVERFQGDERDVIVVSATESDREYLQMNGEFLLDPRRLTVAMSRAKHKMVLVASRSVFTLFSTDDETFANMQLWKNLLRHTCTDLLWDGEREGKRVQVWGNVPSTSSSREG